MKPLKNKVSITLDEDIIERIKQLAEDDDRSFSQYINMVLKEHLNAIEKSDKYAKIIFIMNTLIYMQKGFLPVYVYIIYWQEAFLLLTILIISFYSLSLSPESLLHRLP